MRRSSQPEPGSGLGGAAARARRRSGNGQTTIGDELARNLVAADRAFDRFSAWAAERRGYTTEALAAIRTVLTSYFIGPVDESPLDNFEGQLTTTGTVRAATAVKDARIRFAFAMLKDAALRNVDDLPGQLTEWFPEALDTATKISDIAKAKRGRTPAAVA